MNRPKRHCPECMSTNVDYRKIEFDDERCISITAYGYCHKCKTHFKDHYGVVFKTCDKYDYDSWDGPMSAPVTYGTLEEPPDMGEDEESIVFRMADFAEKHKPK